VIDITEILVHWHAGRSQAEIAESPKLPAVQIRDLAALRWLHTGESVLVYGPEVIDGSVLSGG